jgi:hypothetical protein
MDHRIFRCLCLATESPTLGHGNIQTLQYVIVHPFRQERPHFPYQEKILRILKYSYLVVSLSAPASLVRLTMVAVGRPSHIRDQILHEVLSLL